MELLSSFFHSTALAKLDWQTCVMYLIIALLFYLALVKKFEPTLDHELEVPDNIIRLVQNSLNDVTNYGTAASFFGSGFPVKIAGKTGTAENPQGRDHGWFVAYGPFENPNVVVAVIVEQGGFGALAQAGL